MSRIGRQPIPLPEGVEVRIEPGVLHVQGPRGALEVPFQEGVAFEVRDRTLVVTRANDTKKVRALHGLYRALAANAVRGVTEGFEVGLEVVGTGYRVERKGSTLVFSVGYSHPVEIVIPPELEVRFDPKNKNRFFIKGNDKYLVGQYAAVIRGIRPPMRYKAKGIKYVHETWRLKPGKAGVK